MCVKKFHTEPINSKIKMLTFIIAFLDTYSNTELRMKTLVIIRHAHALPAYVARVSSDAQRPLSEEGLQKAVFTAEKLQQKKLRPDLILTSPLLRAVQTGEQLAKIFSAPLQQETILNGLYADAEVCEWVREQLSAANTLFVISHNPGVAYVTYLLTGQVRSFSPGSFAVIGVEENSAKLLDFGV